LSTAHRRDGLTNLSGSEVSPAAYDRRIAAYDDAGGGGGGTGAGGGGAGLVAVTALVVLVAAPVATAMVMTSDFANAAR